MATSSNHVNVNKSDAKVTKPCRSCLDFKTWRANMQHKTEDSQTQPPQKSAESRPSAIDSDCPVDKDELGRSTWSFLHTMAAYYPDKPTDVQQLKMKTFMHLFSDFYPCEPCAADLREQMRNNPPDTSSQINFSQWLCRIHNGINQRLGKPLFDCLLVDERWRDGWKDGRCD